MPRPSTPKGAPCSHRGAVIGKWPSCWPCYEFAGSRHHISIEDREHYFIGHFDRLAEFCERLEFAWNAPQCYQSQIITQFRQPTRQVCQMSRISLMTLMLLCQFSPEEKHVSRSTTETQEGSHSK